jgi:flavin reductase (DIM6/NTAB) family NADH-FMN oxidoreductase RutF
MTGDELRELMRRFPAPVAVVTTTVDDERYGLTVGSLVSLSLEPPLVGISIGRDSSSHEPIRRAGRFAVSLLSGEQESIAQHFARSGIPPVALWAGTHVHETEFGPRLEDALAWLDCLIWAEYEAGDHTIFVGEVVGGELGTVGNGLVYRLSRYFPV